MHKDQVELASHYALAIAGWGEDEASQPVEHREEQKLVNISSMIMTTRRQKHLLP